MFRDRFPSLPGFMTPESGWIEEDLEPNDESDLMTEVQQEVLKRKLRTNYSMMLHAIVASRVVLLQVIPVFTCVSIYASIMSSSPIMVHSKKLRENLPNQITGLVITQIDNNSPLTNSIEVNSIILEAQKKKIKSSEDLNQVVKKVLDSNQKTILLVIYNSQNQRRYIGVKLD